VLRLGLSTIALIAVGLLAESAHAQSARTPRKPKSVAAARPSSPPSADSLSSITRRGRTLAIRDSIASLGAAAMTSFAVPADSIVRLIVRRSGRGWEVVSGRLSDDQTIFLVTEVSIPGIEPKRWASTTFDPASVDTGYFANAARAIESSITMFRRSSPHTYVAMAIPAEETPWWLVYIYPAASGDGVWPLGGDMRFRVSADGRVITESRRLHESVRQYSVRTARSSTKPSSGPPFVSGDTPEDTDVFHVLQRRPALPELMHAGRFRYRIDVDGTIRMLP